METFIVIVIVGVASGFAAWWCLKFAKGEGGGCGSCASKSSCDKKSCDDEQNGNGSVS